MWTTQGKLPDNDNACGGDCAPFDRVEHMARHLCEEAGGQWDRKGTRKALWRERAAAALASADGWDDVSGRSWLIAGAGWLVGGLSWIAYMVLA